MPSGAAPVVLSKQNPFGWDDERDLVVFNKYGEKAEEFEEAKFEFADAIESAILNVLKENKGLQVGDIVNITNSTDVSVISNITARTQNQFTVRFENITIPADITANVGFVITADTVVATQNFSVLSGATVQWT